MANELSEALLVSTSWNTASDDLTSQPTRTLVKHIRDETVKSDEVSKLYCTVLDVEVSENQKKDAESVGVTLIPATRSKWSDPVEDPPVPNWLLNHDKYYPTLNKLQHVNHVVSFSPMTKNSAAAIHESLFPQAQLHQLCVPTPPGVVFAFDAWTRDACGLTGYHRAIIKNFLTRKANSGEYLKAYSTVVDVELRADQIEDAEKCGVTLIKAERQKGVDEMPNINRLRHHYSYFPDLQKLQNIKYVVGYAPKTGWAAIDIRKKLFPAAKLVLINHVCQEQNCLLVKDEFSELGKEMLQMASQADLLFSIGPHLYDHFQTAYRAVVDGKRLSDIPHKEILPKLRQEYFDNGKQDTGNSTGSHTIVTYGQLKTEEALKRCDSIAASIGSAANNYKTFGKKPLEWKIHGVSEQAYKSTKIFLVEKLQSNNAMLKPYKYNSADSLLQSLQQSDLCLPPSCYTDYSFEGLEAMAAGLPTTVQDDSHIAAMIERHFKYHKDYCVVENDTEELTSKIITYLTKNNIGVKQAKLLKEDLSTSETMSESLANFAALFAEEGVETQNENQNAKAALVEQQAGKDIAKTTIEGKESAETTEVQPGVSVTGVVETSEIKAVQDGKSVKGVMQTLEITAVQSEMSVISGMKISETTAEGMDASVITAVQPGMSVTGGMEISKTTAVQPGMSVKEGMEISETRAVQPEISVTEGMQTSGITAVQAEISVTGGKETSETIQVQPRSSLTGSMESSEITELQPGMSVTGGIQTSGITVVQAGISVTGGNETSETIQPLISALQDTENIGTTPIHPLTSIIGGIVTEQNTAAHSSSTFAESMDISAHSSSTVAESMDISEARAGHSRMPVMGDKETTETKSSQHEMMKATDTDKSDITSNLELTGYGNSDSLPAKSGQHKKQRKRKGKGNREKDTCKQPKVMREEHRMDEQNISSGVGITARDMSGVFKDTIHSRGKPSINPETPVPTPSIQTENGHDFGNFEVHVKLNEESYNQHMKDLDGQVQTRRITEKRKKLKVAWERCQAKLHKNADSVLYNETSQHRVGHICKENLGKVKVKGTTRKSLAISLYLPTLYNLYRLEHTCLSGSFPDSFEPLLITDKMREEADKVGLQLKLRATYDQARFDALRLFFINRDGGGRKPVKVFCDVIYRKDPKELYLHAEETDHKHWTMVTGRVYGGAQITQGQSKEDSIPGFKLERATLESQLKEAKTEKATLEERCNQLTQKLESTEQSLVSQRIGNSKMREKLQSELEEKEKQKKELQDTVDELEFKLEQSSLKKAREKGDWSMTLVNGQHQEQGQKFNGPRGLTFHRDKLVVCDSGNNIVQILNKDYTCDKVLGSFDSQFAKPFRPRSVAISHFNHYFILDDENKQIVVCDENGKIIQIITLPENTKEVWDIALMDDFVLVTLRLISPDTHVRPERDDRLVKYTQNGQFVAEVGGQISGQTQFKWPMSMAVNSKNVIMVYDNGNRCIKCFDSELNFLHQYGQIRLPGEIEGYISVDEDDNIYVCDVRDRIRKYQCDGNLICDLLKDDVIQPMYIAVMGDKICVVERNRDQIKVFSK